MNERLTAVIYARYSSDSQREESIEGQLRECKEYAEYKGITVLSTYIDRALSARTDDRPEFQRMIRDSEKGLFNVVLVWKLDRFSRDRYDSARYKHILKKNGGRIPLGYVLNHQTQKLEIDPVTAPLVVEIFIRYADGETVRSIVDDLNRRGLRTRRGRPFCLNSLTGLLTNRKYIGVYQYQEVVIDGGVPAIVPQELFDRVQRRKERNRRAPAAAKAEVRYLLTTKLFCGRCGRMMVGESGTSRKGVRHHYYKCGNAKRKAGCRKKAVRKQWIEDLVVEHTMRAGYLHPLHQTAP